MRCNSLGCKNQTGAMYGARKKSKNKNCMFYVFFNFIIVIMSIIIIYFLCAHLEAGNSILFSRIFSLRQHHPPPTGTSPAPAAASHPPRNVRMHNRHRQTNLRPANIIIILSERTANIRPTDPRPARQPQLRCSLSKYIL